MSIKCEHWSFWRLMQGSCSSPVYCQVASSSSTFCITSFGLNCNVFNLSHNCVNCVSPPVWAIPPTAALCVCVGAEPEPWRNSRTTCSLCVSTEVRRRRADTELLYAARILSTHLSEQVMFGLSFASQSAQCAHETELLTGIYCLCFPLQNRRQQFGFIIRGWKSNTKHKPVNSLRLSERSGGDAYKPADQPWRLTSKNTVSRLPDADQRIALASHRTGTSATGAPVTDCYHRSDWQPWGHWD